MWNEFVLVIVGFDMYRFDYMDVMMFDVKCLCFGKFYSFDEWSGIVVYYWNFGVGDLNDDIVDIYGIECCY